MGVVMCSRCDKLTDLDWYVEAVVVLPDGMSYACVDCLEEDEFCPECDEPKWECVCKK